MIGDGNDQELSMPPIDPVMEDPLIDGCATTIEEPHGFGRIKAPPVCVDLSLKQESMSTQLLSQWIFPESATFPIDSAQIDGVVSLSPASMLKCETAPSDSRMLPHTAANIPVSVISVSSNTSCGDSYTFSSDDMSEFKSSHESMTNSSSTIVQHPALNREVSERLNAKVLLRKTSRQGRSSQRWASASSVAKGNSTVITMSQSPSCDNTGSVAGTPFQDPVLRLVTGCVPILRSGKILFISASRKPAWILPKGGWEQDESMEESAVRECFEEAGCIGTLGPALTPIQYEARKAKKRRVESELLLEQQAKPKPIFSDNAVDAWLQQTEPCTQNVSSGASNDAVARQLETRNEKHKYEISENSRTDEIISSATTHTPLTSEALSRIRQLSQMNRGTGHCTDTESMSVGSTFSTTCSHVQMTLFPLYVQKIEDEWPEKGRFRKAVDIDEAIHMMENRPEFQAVLIEVRNRRLHLVSATPAANN
jgi:ADP-ribose pyrophosphatase YjhB (NUDIX family)